MIAKIVGGGIEVAQDKLRLKGLSTSSDCEVFVWGRDTYNQGIWKDLDSQKHYCDRVKDKFKDNVERKADLRGIGENAKLWARALRSLKGANIMLDGPIEFVSLEDESSTYSKIDENGQLTGLDSASRLLLQEQITFPEDAAFIQQEVKKVIIFPISGVLRLRTAFA